MAGKIARPTVLASHLRDDGIMDGCNHYRFRIPFEVMRQRVPGGTFDWAPSEHVRSWAGSSASVKPTDYDILLLPRHRPLPYTDEERAAIPEALRRGAAEMGVPIGGRSHLLDLVPVLRLGQSVVLEYDDDYFTEARDLNYEHHDLLRELLALADAVTVSTDYLARLVRKHAPTTPVYVLPNCVNWGEWQERQRLDFLPEDAIVIGLTGSATHLEDWRVLAGVLPRILDEHPRAHFLGAGFLPDYLGEMVETRDRAHFLGTVSYHDYATLVRQCDITLCPVLPDDPFNLGKSALKAIEGMAAGRRLPSGRSGGSVPITSKLYYYQRATGGSKRGLSVEHTPEAWHDAITTLITNNELRMRLSQRGRGWVYQNRAIERQWPLWWDAYREIHRRKR